MMENLDNLSTLVEKENEPENSFSELDLKRNHFVLLCDNVQNCLYEIDKSMFDLLEFKDQLLLQYLPKNVFLHFVLVFSRFYRSYSQSQISINELIRLVQLYSQSFDMKCLILKRFYDNNETKKRLLNFAVQKLTSMKQHETIYQEQKCLNHWEKMYIRLALPRGNVKKWKFRMETFREKSNLGYEHVIAWIQNRTQRISINSEIVLDEAAKVEEVEKVNQLETVNEIVTEQEEVLVEKTEDLIDQPIIDVIDPIALEPLQQEVTHVDVEIQVQPDCDNQQVSTEDILSSKSLLLRIYRPIGIANTKIHCLIHAQGQIYKTKIFILNKSDPQSKAHNRTRKSHETKENVEIKDYNLIDKQQTDEFLIPMPDALQRRSLFQTDLDPHAIKFEIYSGEKFMGALILSSEDLQMLDLSTLYSRNISPYIASEKENLSENNQFDLDQSSAELYQSWLSRIPPTFWIYNDKNQTIGKLPLLMFWYKKTENRCATKSTMTLPMETRVPIPKRVPTPKIEVIIPSATENIVQATSTIDQIEIVKASYEDEILRLHETYQDEIQRLTNLLNQLLSDKEIDPVEYEENISEIRTNNHSPPKPTPTKRSMVSQTSSSATDHSKDLSKNFLDRYEMYLQQRLIHRHELSSKIEQQIALKNERQMEVQHRLYKSNEHSSFDDDLCLPAVFMPFQSGNIINPRAYQFFHSIGSPAPRLTQAPSILKFPSLPARSVSVLNLFELSQAFEKDRSTN